MPSQPAGVEEKEEGEGGDAKVGQECNWTLRNPPPHEPPSPGCEQRRPAPALESESFLLWFPSIIGGWLPGDPEGCVSL